MKTITTKIRINQQLFTSPEWNRIFQPLVSRYLGELFLYQPRQVEYSPDLEWKRERVVYAVTDNSCRRFFTIVGSWCRA